MPKLDGSFYSKEINEATKQYIEVLKVKGAFRVPKLSVILVGDDPASHTYVKKKTEACAAAGIKCDVHRLPSDVQEEEIGKLIDSLNQDRDIDGILLQLPLPKDLQESKSALISRINPNKDVDGIHPNNLGLLATNQAVFTPCTPAGIMYMLEKTNVDLSGKNALVVGRSVITGLPMLLLLAATKAQVKSCDINEQNLEQQVRQADILIVATAKCELVRKDWVKPGCIVIDVGMHPQGNKSFKGDVEKSVSEVAEWYTPVPGGVGPMTVSWVLLNTLYASIQNQFLTSGFIDRGLFPAYRIKRENDINSSPEVTNKRAKIEACNDEANGYIAATLRMQL